MLGLFGAAHSLLHVTTNNGSQFAIEKMYDEIQDTEDVSVTSWETRSSQTSAYPLHSSGPHHLKQHSVQELVVLAKLQDPYDVGSNNCHHSARQLYNLCQSSEGNVVNTLPNRRRALLAAVFIEMGFGPGGCIGSFLINF
jgi:hypothetical protein